MYGLLAWVLFSLLVFILICYNDARPSIDVYHDMDDDIDDGYSDL